MRKLISLVLAVMLLLSVAPAFASEEVTYSEAPMLAAKVASGELPAVKERLPENPLVIEAETIGVYGGNWVQNLPWDNRSAAMEDAGDYAGNCLLYKVDNGGNYVGNLASEWTANEDYTAFTFTLRKGLKWSDGEPFTTQDFKFYLDYQQYLDPDDPEAKLGTDKYATATMEIADDYTFTITFTERQPFYYTEMASNSNGRIFYPAHYMKQFFKGTADAETLQANLDALGFSDWKSMFEDRVDRSINPDLPSMAPWILKTDTSAATQVVWERNPYYWAVDAEGNQLPYIDTMTWNIVETTDVAKMMAIAGEFDMGYAALFENTSDYILFAQYAEEQGYTIKTLEWDEPGAMNIHINHAHRNEAKRAIMETQDFRKAMSYAINRDEIIAAMLTVGPFVSEKRNFSPSVGSAWYDESWSSANTEYDVDKANELLDGLGLTARGSNGYRLLPDGSEFVMVIEVPTFSDDWINYGNMLATCWQKVGLNVTARAIAPSLWGELMTANEYDITIFTGGGGMGALTRTTINDYTGFAYFDWPLRYMSGNLIWRDNPEAEGAVEPDENVKKLWELGQTLYNTTDPAEQEALLQQIFQIHKDQLYILGIGNRLPSLMLVKNYMRNVPDYHNTNERYLQGYRTETIWMDETAK